MESLKRYAYIAWLPAALTLLLAAETVLFNDWLGVASGVYFWRCAAASISLGTVLFFPVVFFSMRRGRLAYLTLVSAAVFLIFLSQFLYYKYSNGFLQASSLAYANQSADLMGTVVTLLTYRLLFFALPFVFIAADFFVSRRLIKRMQAFATITENPSEPRLLAREKIMAAFFMLVFFCAGYGMLLRLELADSGDLGRLYVNSEMYNLDTLVGKAGIVNFYLESLVKFVAIPNEATGSDVSFLKGFASGRAPVPHGADFGAMKGKNLIFIQVESLENWVIGYKINGVLVAPNLTALSKEGKYFTNYYSQIGEGNTADAEFSTLNSLYPLPDSVAFIAHAKNTYAALPRLLFESGYSTAVMHGDVATFWNRSNAYPPLGYKLQLSQKDYVIPRPVGFESLGDADFFRESIPKLEALKQPFMSTLITLSTHTPFALPADLETLQIPDAASLTPTQQQYLQAVHYSDAALGDFIKSLKADGLHDASLIAIYGDHTAFIGTPDSSTEHVPLILLGSSEKLHGSDAIPASHLDLYPTVADLLGIEPPVSVLGQDVLETKRPVVTARIPGTGAIKFIIGPDFKYTGSADGIFEDGTCVKMPGHTSAPVSSCQLMYDEQVTITKASDDVVRFNLLSLIGATSTVGTSTAGGIR